MSKRRSTSPATPERSAPERSAPERPKPEQRPPEQSAPARSDLPLAIAFNLGMAMFVVGASCDLISPSTSDAFFSWKHALSSLGLLIAGPAWLAGSNYSASLKYLLSAVIVGAILFTAGAGKVETDGQASLLQPWRVEANRLVHDGLGVSLPALPGWSYNLQPRPLREAGSAASGSTGLAMGEVAVFLQLTHKLGESGATSAIVLQGGPRVLDEQSLAQFALAREQMTAQRPNAKILQHVQEGQIAGGPAMAYIYQDPAGRYLQEVMFRCGSCLLTLFTTAASDEDAKQVNELLQSIRFTEPGTVAGNQ